MFENVRGILHARHKAAFIHLIQQFEFAGYFVTYKLVNAKEYGVPQDRFRVIVVGYHKQKVGFLFVFPPASNHTATLHDAISDLPEPVAFKRHTIATSHTDIKNHEYSTSGFSPRYLSRNRVRDWHEQSFTIQASSRHIPLHPQAPKAQQVEKDRYAFANDKEHLYRRLSVRECARIQTFPDPFEFIYSNIEDGYRMVGNAVSVLLATTVAKKITADLKK